METTLFYARAACDTMMRKFAAADLPPKGHFYYHQGVFLSGVLKTWQLTGEQKYLDYAASWVYSVFDESGKVKQYKRADLDDIQAGILLYTLYDATGDEFYRRCIESVAAQVQDIPRCQCGGFWHTCGSSNQMWLDGLYMACPFIAEYARRFDRPEWTDLVVNEIRLMREHTRDAQDRAVVSRLGREPQSGLVQPRNRACTGILGPQHWLGAGGHSGCAGTDGPG